MIWALLLLGAACSASDSSTETKASAPPPEAQAVLPKRDAQALPHTSAHVSRPFDLAGVMKQVHFAYRVEGDHWTGGHRTYEVLAATTGFAVTPMQAADDARTVAPARFETAYVGRGGARLATAKGEGRIEQDGHLAIVRGAVTEHLQNDEDGVEQSFAFAEEPAGNGDVEVHVRVTGQDYAGETATGHHFVDPITGLGVRYGAATWVDARGERTTLEVAWDGQELVITVPNAVAEGAVYPAVIDPIVGPELGIDQPVYGASSADQTRPAMAASANGYFVVWYDTRGPQQIYGARLSSAGLLLDPGGIPISRGSFSASNQPPAVTFDGTNYGVAWSGTLGTTKIVRAARVSTSGVVLDPFDISVYSTSTSQISAASIASDGAKYLVVWSNTDIFGEHDVRGALVGAADAFVSSSFPLSTAASDQRDPAVAFDGTGYLVVWQDSRNGFYDIYGARVSKAGAVLDANGISISTAANDQKEPAVTFDGSNHFVIWNDGRAGASTPDVYGARVSTLGFVYDTSGIAISQAAGVQSMPAVAFDGTNDVVTWADTRAGNSDVYMARVNPSGTVLDPAGVAVSSGAATESAPAIACGGASCFIAWEDNRAGTSYDVYGARVSGGTVTDGAGILVTTSANDEEAPAVAFDGTNYLAVWQDNRSATWDIYGARVTPSGTVLDPSGIAISTAIKNQITPRLAWMAPSYLVVWQDTRADFGDIYAARVDATGAVLDPNGLPIATSASTDARPAVAGDGTNFFVAWSANSNGLRGTRVAPDGSVLDAGGIAIYSSAIDQPSLAFDGVQYLVVWGAGGSVRGSRITPAGALLDGSTGFNIYAGSRPQVGFNGTSFLTAFWDNVQMGIRGVRVSSAGTVLDPSTLAIAPYQTFVRDQPAMACDSAACLVVWREYRGGYHSIYGGFVDPVGTILNPGGFAIAAPAYQLSMPALAAGGAGHWLVAYQEFLPFTPFGDDRVYARLVTSLAPGKPCTQAAECSTNFCVDGVCCDTACGNGAADCSACSAALGATKDGTCTPLTGTTCDDGNKCTQTDVCQAGTCKGSPVTCTALDPCHDPGTCNPATGTCSNPAKPNGVVCDDGNKCTLNDTCNGGLCTAGNPVTCPTADQCHDVAACDPSSGTCAVTPKADGTACDDGDANTVGDVCTAGSCAGVDHCVGVTCAAQDQCHVAGICIDHATGACSNPVKADGTACDDGSPNTVGDVCNAGVCAGVDHCIGVLCAPKDQCHVAGTCVDHTTGACDNPVKADGAACDDGNPNTVGDVCTAGVCAGVDHCIGVLCAPKDQCHVAGTCVDHATGACDNPVKADGAACDDGNPNTVGDVCNAGVCAGVDHCIGVICTPKDQCHVAGTCVDHTTGACDNPVKADGAACDDGNPNTTGDACTAGVCAGVDHCIGVLCAPKDQCHVAGTCVDHATGACDNPVKADGAACDDDNPNTTGDACTAGVCAGIDHCIGVTCIASDECHDAGTCIDHASGACNNPAKADGTPCSLGICQQGTCTASPDAGAGGSGGAGMGGSTAAGGSDGGPATGGSGGMGTGGTSSTSSSTSSSGSSSSGAGGGDTSSSSTSSASGKGGCGCRTAGGEPDDGRNWMGALGLALVLARRHRAAVSRGR
ncbi:MAG: MYXO-CTERM sorting domain-containing protein [Minicystis sp.]